MKYRLLCLVLVMILSGCNVASRGDTGSSSGNGNMYLSAWYVNDSRGLQSFSQNSNLFKEINPVWYNLNPSYFIPGQAPLAINTANKEVILSLAKEHGIKVVPTIQNWGASNFDPAVISTIINDSRYQTKHVAEIVSLVKNEGYDGIEIDYESLPVSDRQSFTAFINELGSELRKIQKTLSVAVYAKTAEVYWQGAGAQDWAALLNSVDSLKVMAYDYHWVSFHPGPISPTDWLRDVLSYAATVPGIKGKIIIGLPLYGLNWGGGTVATEVMYQDAIKLMNDNLVTDMSRISIVHSDPICSGYYQNVEPHFSYIKDGLNHTVYFQDAQSLKERFQILSQYRWLIKGITLWHLGGEDPLSWNEIRSFI